MPINHVKHFFQKNRKIEQISDDLKSNLRYAALPKGHVLFMDLKAASLELKKLLCDSDDLQSVVDYFLSNFAENPRWKNKGNKAKIKNLKTIISDIISSKFDVENLTIFASHDKKNAFVHGPISFKGGDGLFIYMPSINKGIISVANQAERTMDCFRFSLMTKENMPETILLSDDTELTKLHTTTSTHTIQ